MKAKSFSLTDQQGTRRALKDYRGRYVVLYFYPRDFTSGCTTEACGFRDARAELETLGAVVVGVSKDTDASHDKFDTRHGLGFTLLSDPDLRVTKSYEAFGTKNMYGKSVEGVKRSTFLIGPDGTVIKAWKGVRVAGHVDKVVAALREAKGDG